MSTFLPVAFVGFCLAIFKLRAPSLNSASILSCYHDGKIRLAEEVRLKYVHTKTDFEAPIKMIWHSTVRWHFDS
jgi:hypothetical protein